MSTRNTRRRSAALAAAATAAALLLAGCGSGDDEGSGRTPDAADVTIDPRSSDGSLEPGERVYFAADSPWNTRVDGAKVDPRSKELMDLATLRVGVRETGDRVVTQPRRIEDPVYINTEAWTTPVVAGGEPTNVVCRQARCGDGDDTVVLDIPTDVDPDPRYDGWFTIFDTAENTAYDLWRARREDDGSISYHFMRKWDLDGPGYSPPQVVGARGSGLPLFAGLIRPGELQAGEINHALAISVPGPAEGSFVQPASSTDGNGSPDSLPEGARIRLRADVVPAPPVDPETGKPIEMTAQQQRLADAIVVALRTYGAIVVDRARVPTLYAQRDVTAELIRGNELQGLFLDDFEVVELPSRRYQYPPERDADPSGLLPSSAATTESGERRR